MLNLTYQLRYILGFVGFALLLGTGFGLLSSYLVRSAGSNSGRTHSRVTRDNETTQYQIIQAPSDEEPKMRGALYREESRATTGRRQKRDDRGNDLWSKEQEEEQEEKPIISVNGNRTSPSMGRGDVDRFGKAMSRLAARRKAGR